MKNKFYSILFVILGLSLNAFAQPANNFCSGAITLPQNGNCLSGTTAGASDGLAGTVGCAGNNAEVWYSFTPTGTSAQIVVTNGTQGGNVEVVLLAASGACSGLTVQGSNCGASVLTATFNNLQPILHYVLISSSGTNGTFTICNTVTTPPPAPGVNCTSAAPLCSGSSFSQGTFTGIGVAENISTNSCFGGNERQAKWYTFTAGSTGTFGFVITPTTLTNDFDWALWNTTNGCYSTGTTMGAPISCNWSGCSGSTGIHANPATVPGANNANGNGPGGCGGTYSAFNTTLPTLTAGQTYTLLIDNFSSSGGGFNMTFGGTAIMGPIADFTASFGSNCLTLSTNRSPYYTGANTTYLWSFGDGNTSTAAQPTHTYAAIGNYFITLTVTDANGCTDTHSIEVSGCMVLPINLLSFEGNYNGRNVDLKWSTASETNNEFFTIERSKDGKDFEQIGVVKGAGNSNRILNYETVDSNPYDGLSYYRLKQTDFDGKFEYSELVAVTVKNNKESFIVYPNPVANNAEISFNSHMTDNAVLNIMDATGRLVLSKKVSSQKGVNVVKLDTDNLTKGIYFVTLTNTYEVLKTKFVKE
ncbi:MAG: PKD domain-containing protein [Bacteroidota bacterium]|nr:PKD domain-containing protein [Bacteroidota bacterium]